MARIRSIKPEFFIDEDLQDLEAENPGAYCMLVYAGLWGHCSKDGVFEYRPRVLKLSILPFLNFSLETTLALLCAAGFVRRFSVEGKEYGHIPSFEKHQRISGKEAQYSPKFPTPDEEKNGVSLPGKHWGSTGEAPGETKGSNREAQEREREKEREEELQQQQQYPPISPPALGLGDNGGAVELLFRKCFEENEAKLSRLFPDADFSVERELCVAFYRKRAPPLDPLPVVLKWFQRIRNGKGGDNGCSQVKGGKGRARGIVPANGPDADWLGG